MKKYIEITHDNVKCIQTLKDAQTFIESLEDGEIYSFK